MDYVNRLDNFDGPAVGDIAVGNELYEEAFAIFKKFDHHEPAIKVLLENLNAMERAIEYAEKVHHLTLSPPAMDCSPPVIGFKAMLESAS
jgi:hypothetical protein